MKTKPLTVKTLIKILNEVKEKYGDIRIGLNVLTGDDVRSEFWGLDKKNVELHDGGYHLSVATLRLRKALPERLLQRKVIPVVDSVNLGAFGIIQEFDQRYELKDDLFKLVEDTDVRLVDVILETVKWDLENTARFYDDVRRQLDVGNQPSAEEVITEEFKKAHQIRSKA